MTAAFIYTIAGTGSTGMPHARHAAPHVRHDIDDGTAMLEGGPQGGLDQLAAHAGHVDDDGRDLGRLAVTQDERHQARDQDRGNEQKRERRSITPDLGGDPPEDEAGHVLHDAREEGLGFAIREGGRTVGAGVVSKVLK